MPHTSSFHDPLIEQTPFYPLRQPETTKELEATASLIRNLIGIGEKQGLSRARQLKKAWRNHLNPPTPQTEEEEAIDLSDLGEAVTATIFEHLALPKSVGSGRTKAEIPLLVPLTPAMAQVTAFTRLSGNPWNPGAYFQGMILRGSKTLEAAQELWGALGLALAIGDWDSGVRDDIWASLIEERLTKDFPGIVQEWDGTKTPSILDFADKEEHPGPDQLDASPCPAKAFVDDLQQLIRLKPAVTRRQWLSMIDSFLRLALASDLLWIGALNQGLRQELRHQLNATTEVPLPTDVGAKLLPTFQPIPIGTPLKDTLIRETQEYVRSRLFVSVLLHELRLSVPEQLEGIADAGGLHTPQGICHLLQLVRDNNDRSLLHRIDTEVSAICNNEPKLMQCDNSGTITANFYWCIRHSLGQRQTNVQADSHFDQGYWAKKALSREGKYYSSAPWFFDLGPVALITFTHLACTGIDGLGTVSDFRRRLGLYGVTFEEDELNNGRVGRAIRSLGLVIDSPDAEGGMLLRSPFTSQAATS